MTGLVLRRATVGDAKLLWQWCNDPDVRAAAFNTEAVTWETHEAWLDRKLTDAGTRIWILEHDGEPVGQVRYDRNGDVGEIDYSVTAALRGRAFGTALLERSAPLACGELRVTALVGLVRTGNVASCRAFEGAGFARVGMEYRHGAACVRYEWRCPGAGR